MTTLNIEKHYDLAVEGGDALRLTQHESLTVARVVNSIRMGGTDGGMIITPEGGVGNINKERFALIEVAIRALEDDRGSSTPIENFLDSVLIICSQEGASFDKIESAFDELEQDWMNMIDALQIQSKRYPDVVIEAMNEAGLKKGEAL